MRPRDTETMPPSRMKSGSGRDRAADPVDRHRARKAEDASEIVNNLRKLFKAIHEYSKAMHGRTGFSGPQIWALRILAANPELSLGELAERMFAHPSTVSGIVDRLRERGAVQRVVDRADRRGVRLSLTAAGRRVVRTGPPPVQQGISRALERMPPGRLRSLRRSLEAIVRETAAAGVEAPLFDNDDGIADRGRRRPRG
jgi:DNA-binding MarR family transcriptional regulator